MAEPSRLRLRTALSWLATLAVIAFALSHELSHEPAPSSDDADSVDADTDKVRIVDLQPLELTPGAAVIAYVEGAPDAAELGVEIAKQPAEILHRGPGKLVVRVPRDLPYGQAKLRVSAEGKRSKPWVITVRPLPRDAMLRNILGGLALFVLGLRTLGRALRAYAGRRVRALVSLLTRGLARPAVLGAALGLAMQSTTSVAGLLAGLSGARMLKPRAAVTLLIGAQLGAAAAAVLLPLVATREALWIVCVGLVWLVLAPSRLSRALGAAVLGAGIVFHGLGLLQTGFAPLVSDPEVIPYLAHFTSHDALGLASCVAAGAALSGLLQGPSAVFALIMSLASSSGLIGLNDGLAVLAGVNLGAVLGGAAAAWPFGGDARRMVAAHALLAFVMTAVAVLGLPLWVRVADAVVAGSPTLASRKGDLLLPLMGMHLGVGFVALELAAVLCVVPLVPSALRIVERLRGGVRRGVQPQLSGKHPAQLAMALALLRRAFGSLVEITKSGDRAASPGAEQALSEAGDALRALLADEAAHDLRPAAVACLQLRGALESALRIAEQGPEHGYVLAEAAASAHERLHSIADAALASIVDGLGRERAPNLDEAQAREIELNAIESEARRAQWSQVGEQAARLPSLLWSSELIAAYEAIGNQLYRVTSALGASAHEID